MLVQIREVERLPIEPDHGSLENRVGKLIAEIGLANDADVLVASRQQARLTPVGL